MNKTAIIIIVLLSLALIASIYISSTNHSYYKYSLSELRKKQAETAKQLKAAANKTKADSIQNERNLADYLVSLAQVERYKKERNNTLKRESDEIQRNKTVIPGLTNIQVDSAFKFMYPRTDSAVYH